MLFFSMSKLKNCDIYRKNSYYHLYNRGNHRGKIFLREKDYKIFKNLMYKYLKRHKLLLVGYCLMPNHYHLIVKCGRDVDAVTKFMRAFMVAYVMYFNRFYSKVGHLFQGPFQVRRLNSLFELEVLIDYLRENPKKAGLVKDDEMDDYGWLYISKNRDW